MYVWKVRERNVWMKSKRKKCTYEKLEKEMYGGKVREKNVRMKSKRKKCTYEQ